MLSRFKAACRAAVALILALPGLVLLGLGIALMYLCVAALFTALLLIRSASGLARRDGRPGP